eukprot:767153-Hanusia_phi.AAC.1
MNSLQPDQSSCTGPGKLAAGLEGPLYGIRRGGDCLRRKVKIVQSQSLPALSEAALGLAATPRPHQHASELCDAKLHRGNLLFLSLKSRLDGQRSCTVVFDWCLVQESTFDARLPTWFTGKLSCSNETRRLSEASRAWTLDMFFTVKSDRPSDRRRFLALSNAHVTSECPGPGATGGVPLAGPTQ